MRIGSFTALLIVILFALTIWYLSSGPSGPASGPIIDTLGGDTCSIQDVGEGNNKAWILENSMVRATINARTAEILELVCKENGVKHIVHSPEPPSKRPWYSAIIQGRMILTPMLSSRCESSEDGVCIVFKGKSNDLMHEIGMMLRRGSPSIEVSYSCTELAGRPVTGTFRFRVPGCLGEKKEDDVLAVPAEYGIRKFDAPSAFLRCPKHMHPFSSWFACIDRQTEEMLVFRFRDTELPKKEMILLDFGPTGYSFGLERERLDLEAKGCFEVSFELAPLSRTIVSVLDDDPSWQQVRNLYRNLDLFLAVPPGHNPIEVAPWGIAHAKLSEQAIEEPRDVKASIICELNRNSSACPPIRVILSLSEHGSEDSLYETAIEELKLGGFWHKREKKLELLIPASAMKPGRLDVKLAFVDNDAGVTFEQRLNLGVASEKILLPPPDLKTSMPVERVIAKRMSQRVFKEEALDQELLSYVLYHSAGLIKKDAGRFRETVIHEEASAAPCQSELFVYFTHIGAVYRYDRLEHALVYHQSRDIHYPSELEEENILAYSRTRTFQAPILLIVADRGGEPKAVFQNIHLAAAAAGLGFCIYEEESHHWLRLPPGYEESSCGRLGIPFTPFLFEPRDAELEKSNMPLVDAVWSAGGSRLAEYDNAPREGEMLVAEPNLPPVEEGVLTLEQSIEQARQAAAFEPGYDLKPQEKVKLLWAAYGRSYLREPQKERDYYDHRRVMFVPGGVHRTVPSACGEYLMDIYVADRTGIYQYFGKRHHLTSLAQGDRRAEILDLLDAGFENPALLILFARRDLMKYAAEGCGYEEALFAAQNMSLVGAAAGLGIGCARVNPALQQDEEARAAWRKVIGNAGSTAVLPFVGGENNRAPRPPFPGMVVAAGRPLGKDPRLFSLDTHPVAFKYGPAPKEKQEGSSAAPGKDKETIPVDQLRDLFPQASSFNRSESEKYAPYYYTASRKIRQEDRSFRSEILGFVAKTTRIAPEVMGYHGPIDILLALGPNGRIEKLKLLHHSETPEHMDRIMDSRFLSAFEGRAPGEMPDVDMVSGATVSCVAMTRAVLAAQDRLCGVKGGENAAGRSKEPDKLARITMLAFLFTLAFCLLRAKKTWRHVVLAVSAVFMGCAWNWSFSYTDLLDSTALIGLLTAVFVTLVAASTLFSGRIYCGWICPFGAVQEFAAIISSPVMGKAWKTAGSGARAGKGGKLQLVKYAVLACLLLAVVSSGIKGFLNPEPFVDFFAMNSASWRFYLGVAAVLVSFAITRPFCRYLCPSGALLGSLNRLKGRVEKRAEFKNCTGCGTCVSACPTGAVVIENGGNRVLGRGRFECIGCEECVKATASGACGIKRKNEHSTEPEKQTESNHNDQLRADS